jgi:hypothetical protein
VFQGIGSERVGLKRVGFFGGIKACAQAGSSGLDIGWIRFSGSGSRRFRILALTYWMPWSDTGYCIFVVVPTKIRRNEPGKNRRPYGKEIELDKDGCRISATDNNHHIVEFRA